MDFDFFRVREYSLIPDSGGDGAFRGGLGIRRRYEILAALISVSRSAMRFAVSALMFTSTVTRDSSGLPKWTTQRSPR